MLLDANKNYYIDRQRSIKIEADVENVESDCQVITFFCAGDTPCFIEVVGGIRRRIQQNQQVSFGTDIPNIQERNKFNIIFDVLATTREVHVERAVYVEDKNC